jgi:hypothetical protein
VFAVAARLWRVDARTPLPILAAAAVTAWVLWDGTIVYADLIAQSSWTAATIVIPYVPVKAALLAVLAYYAVRSLLALRAPPPRLRTHRLLAAGLTALLAVALASDVLSSMEATHVRTARSPDMTADQVAAEIQRVTSGTASRSEVLAFLENPLCPAALLEEYAKAERLFKTQVARNPRVPEDIILRLSQDSDPVVRYYAAYSSKLPVTELTRLAGDADAMVRETVVWKKNLPDEDFARLVVDSAPRVRAAAALQPRASDAEILHLTMDPDTGVRANATRIAIQRGLQEQ